MKTMKISAVDITRIIRESQAAMMQGERLSIKGRDDLMTAVERITYQVESRTGFLYLADMCTVNYDGCIRLFTDIDPKVKRIEVFSGTKPDGVYQLTKGEWKVYGFPFPH